MLPVAKWNYSFNPLLPDTTPATKNNNNSSNMKRSGWMESGRKEEWQRRGMCSSYSLSSPITNGTKVCIYVDSYRVFLQFGI